MFMPQKNYINYDQRFMDLFMKNYYTVCTVNNKNKKKKILQAQKNGVILK